MKETYIKFLFLFLPPKIQNYNVHIFNFLFVNTIISLCTFFLMGHMWGYHLKAWIFHLTKRPFFIIFFFYFTKNKSIPPSNLHFISSTNHDYLWSLQKNNYDFLIFFQFCNFFLVQNKMMTTPKHTTLINFQVDKFLLLVKE